MSQREKYNLIIGFTRHGRKTGPEGVLSREGKEEAKKYFDSKKSLFEEYSDADSHRIVSSPIERCVETAEIFRKSVDKKVKIEIENKLSGGGHAYEIYKRVPENEKDLWFKYYYLPNKRSLKRVLMGKELVARMCQWILREYRNSIKSNQFVVIESFTHGETMAGFVICIEDEMKINILPKAKNEDERYDNYLLFDKYFPVLSNIELRTTLKDKDCMELRYKNKKYKVPLDLVKKFALYKIQ